MAAILDSTCVRVRMLNFTRQYKDILQRRLIILMSFYSKFIGAYVHR